MARESAAHFHSLVDSVHSFITGVKKRLQMDLGFVFVAHRFDEVLALQKIFVINCYISARAVDITVADAGVDSESKFANT